MRVSSPWSATRLPQAARLVARELQKWRTHFYGRFCQHVMPEDAEVFEDGVR